MSEDRLEAAKEIAAKWRELSKQIVIDIPAQAAIILDDRITELEKCRTDIADWRGLTSIEQDAVDWKGLTSIEQDAGMGWKDRAEKAEAEIKRLKALLSYQGIHF